MRSYSDRIDDPARRFRPLLTAPTLLVVMAVVIVGAAGYLLSRPEQRHAPVAGPAPVPSTQGRRSSAQGNPRAAR